MNIKCVEEDNFEFTRRITSSCNLDFEYTADNVYQIRYVNYFGDMDEQFYTMCPRCGRIIPISSGALTEYEKQVAREKTDADIYLYQKNDIISEYINVCNSTRVKKKTL